MEEGTGRALYLPGLGKCGFLEGGVRVVAEVWFMHNVILQIVGSIMPGTCFIIPQLDRVLFHVVAGHRLQSTPNTRVTPTVALGRFGGRFTSSGASQQFQPPPAAPPRNLRISGLPVCMHGRAFSCVPIFQSSILASLLAELGSFDWIPEPCNLIFSWLGPFSIFSFPLVLSHFLHTRTPHLSLLSPSI